MKKIFALTFVVILFLTACMRQNHVVIENRFADKIVYSNQNTTNAMVADCKQREGEFDECGSSCSTDAEFCTEVCVPVCLINEDQDRNNETNEINGGINETGIDLNVPANFKISELTTDVSGARVLVGPDSLGNYWLSRTDKGIISNLEMDEEGKIKNISNIFTGLDKPHGLALDPEDGLTLYIAETDKVSRIGLYTEDSMEELVQLPGDGRHFTRTLHFGPYGKLYISIGSSCDTCIEDDERRASIYVMNKDGSDFKEYAKGLRNSVFMATDPVYGDIWATEMGRDDLGDNLPPDEINIVKEGKDYGWPYCYGDQIRDSEFMPENQQNYCNNTEPAKVELQAHSAPLGLAFIPEEGWPEEMWLDMIVAYHGSWNRTIPTGYKLMWIKLDDQRNVVGREDFINGWITEDFYKLGRPVDVLIQPGGKMYVTDDQRGAIYIIEHISEKESSDSQDSKKTSNENIIINKPKKDTVVHSPMSIEGEARGTWFFEGAFSVLLLDKYNNEIAQTNVSAEGEWTTEDFVPFKGELTFSTDANEGTLVFKKANPSGLPENDEKMEIPVNM